ncbi:alkaline phosphatase [Acetobacterium wieringae]|uniref:alkaline phosphatase n=1 Tax=Acetobacterium wieringae TaxID=52694 RepID=UPI0031588A66
MKKVIKRGVATLGIALMLGMQLSTAVFAEELETNATLRGVPLVFEGNCSYQTQIENLGWQDWKSKMSISGTSEKGLRLEGIRIKISDIENLGVSYQTHVQNLGWQDWVDNGEMSGTEGDGLRLEGVRIKLDGSEAWKYDIYYQVHVENMGWMDWVKNGELAGTEGKSHRLEGIKIVVLPKGSVPPVNTGSVKNVILMISDGCGSNELLATNYYTTGKAEAQIYEQFPVELHMSTYSHNEIGMGDDLASVYDPKTIWNNFATLKNFPTDSAAAATAMSTGTKTYNAALGKDENGLDLVNICEDFEAQNKATGVITSVEFSHATPAGFVAHNASRQKYSEIANEMIRDSQTDVIMGAGNPMYDNNGQIRTVIEDKNYNYVGGKETWESLVTGQLGNDADQDGSIENWNLIQSKDAFESLTTGETPERVIGVPEVYETLQYNREGDVKAEPYVVALNENVPTLDVMTKGALNVLDNQENGFFLMVEGGAIDWAGHGNASGRLIEEEVDFNNSVNAVCEWVEKNSSWSETMVIVTGDHETGYLTGTAGVYDEVINNGKGNMPTMVWNSGDHTNQLIPLFAKGPGAELLLYAANGSDPVKGSYIDNTEIVLAIRSLLK